MADDWKDAPIVDAPTWQDAAVVDPPETTKVETAFKGLSFLNNYGKAPFGTLEGVVTTVGNLGVKSVAGLAGITAYGLDAQRADDAYDPGQDREDFESGRPRLTGDRNPNLAAETVEYVEDAGREIFSPVSESGEQAEAALGKAVEGAGQAIKYPLSAVPFAIGGSEEREQFMEMPMSQYLGELAEDGGASPFWATMAHMIPDAAIMAVGTKGAGKAAKPGKPTRPNAPTVEQLKADSSALYKIVDDSGIRISDEAFQTGVSSIIEDAIKGGARKSLTPKTWAALEELSKDAAVGGLTLTKAEELRRVLKKAQKGVDADLGSATRALNAYDKFIEGLRADQITGAIGAEGVEYLKSARSLWSRARKTEQIEDIIDTAGLNAGMYTGSGFENALRNGFRKLARKKKEMRMFTKAEQEVIRAVAFGTPTGNLMRQLGKLAPTGIVSAGMGSGAGFVVGGPLGAVAVPTVGSLARAAATRSTIKAAEKASETMARGAE
jgi:hypothetical protein